MFLDSASLYYRAFHGVPTSLTAPDGTPVNALRGFLDSIALLARELQPDQIVAAWDVQWRPLWRVDLLPSYKSHRVVAGTDDVEDTPPELLPQVPLIQEALGHLGIPIIGADDHEADDVIGTLVAASAGQECLVVTGDRDLFQLVDDAAPCRVVYTGGGLKALQHVDEDWLRTKYGIDSARYVDFAVLRGDPSDGLSGVPGIGDKTAARLLAAHGGLKKIVEAAVDETSAMTPRVRTGLLDHQDYLERAEKVVAVRRDLPLPWPVPVQSVDVPGFLAFGQRWGLGQVTQRVLDVLA